MKKLSILCVVVMSLFFVGCEKEKNEPKDPNAITKENIVGRWNVTHGYSDKYSEWVDLTDEGPNYMYAIFNADKTYKAKMIDSSYSGTWELIDKQVICNVSGTTVYYTILEFSQDKVTFDFQLKNATTTIKLKAVRSK